MTKVTSFSAGDGRQYLGGMDTFCSIFRAVPVCRMKMIDVSKCCGKKWVLKVATAESHKSLLTLDIS
jgi:hypothetical protein